METVVLLSQQHKGQYIRFSNEINNLENKHDATYQEIKDYIDSIYGVKISSGFIAQVKREFGLIERDSYNLGSEGHRVPQCTPEKRQNLQKTYRSHLS